MVQRKYIPISRSTVYTIFKKIKLTDYCPDEWHLEGRKLVMTVTSFNSKIEDHFRFKSSGCTVTTLDIINWLTDVRQTTAINNQHPLSQIKTIHHDTSLIYRKIPACSNKRNVVTKVQQKTESYYIAKNSVISTITYIFTVATPHLLIGRSLPNLHTRKLNEVSPGAQLLASLVSRADNGSTIHHVLPAMITSTDVTTVFVFRGVSTKLEDWYLIEPNNKGSKQSLYLNDEGVTNLKKD